MQLLTVQNLNSKTTAPDNLTASKIESYSSQNFKDLVSAASKADRAEPSEKNQKLEKSDKKDRISENEKKVKTARTDKSSGKQHILENEGVSQIQNEEGLEQNRLVEESSSGFSFTDYKVSGDQDFQETVFAAVENESQIELTGQQLSYLKSTENYVPQDDFDALIENASEYVIDRSDEAVLNKIQNLSVEDPELFLSQAEHAEENFLAGTLNPDSVNGLKETFGIKENPSAENKDSKENNDFFTYTVSAGDRQDNFFEIIDERSLSEKLASLESSKEKFSKDNNTLDFTMNLTQTAQQNILSSDSQTASAQGSNFQQMLTQQIQTNAPDFVKAGQLILKDSNSGVINMNLKPESLGNVKLTLQVSDKVITGQITVHSKEAFEAFRQNLDTLKQAFLEQGFEDASFNLNLAQNQNGGSFQNAKQDQAFNGFLSEKAYGDYGQSNEGAVSSEAAQAYERSGDYRIDVVA